MAFNPRSTPSHMPMAPAHQEIPPMSSRWATLTPAHKKASLQSEPTPESIPKIVTSRMGSPTSAEAHTTTNPPSQDVNHLPVLSSRKTHDGIGTARAGRTTLSAMSSNTSSGLISCLTSAPSAATSSRLSISATRMSGQAARALDLLKSRMASQWNKTSS